MKNTKNNTVKTEKKDIIKDFRNELLSESKKAIESRFNRLAEQGKDKNQPIYKQVASLSTIASISQDSIKLLNKVGFKPSQLAVVGNSDFYAKSLKFIKPTIDGLTSGYIDYAGANCFCDSMLDIKKIENRKIRNKYIAYGDSSVKHTGGALPHATQVNRIFQLLNFYETKKDNNQFVLKKAVAELFESVVITSNQYKNKV